MNHLSFFFNFLFYGIHMNHQSYDRYPRQSNPQYIIFLILNKQSDILKKHPCRIHVFHVRANDESNYCLGIFLNYL